MYRIKYKRILADKTKRIKKIVKTVRTLDDTNTDNSQTVRPVSDFETSLSFDDKFTDFINRSIDTSLCKISKIILIEFLTMNVYSILKRIMNDLYKVEIKLFILGADLTYDVKSSRSIRENSKNLQTLVEENLLENDELRSAIHHYIRYSINKDFEILSKQIRLDYEEQFGRSISKPSSIPINDSELDIQEKTENEEFIPNSIMFFILNKIFFVRFFCPILAYSRQQKENTTCLGSAQINGKFVNKILKSLCGFFFSFFYIFLFYFYLRYQHLADATVGVPLLCLIGLLLMFGLSFYSKFRAIALLILPFFASLQGNSPFE
jgi:hypothetical protein